MADNPHGNEGLEAPAAKVAEPKKPADSLAVLAARVDALGEHLADLEDRVQAAESKIRRKLT